MTSGPPRVLALVLTYNAPAALERCLDALDHQTRRPDGVLVVDNCSEPPATLRTRPHERSVLRRTVNDGPAGGHGAGLRAFMESGQELAWVMDVDCVPEANCLEMLLARRAGLLTEQPVFPLWVEEATGEARFLPAWCGFLISRAAVAKIGLPRADLVWWTEDTEYLQTRLIGADLTPVEERSAVVRHCRIRTSSCRPAWKIYYETRNTIEFRLFVQRRTPRHVRYLMISMAGLGRQATRRGPARRARCLAFARGLKDGALRNSGLRVPLP